MSEPSAPLTLIGTVHRDPGGEIKLLALLEALRPARITLELSPYALDFRRRRSRTLLRYLDRILEQLALRDGVDPALLAAHPAVADIRELLTPPFEYRAAAAFAGHSGISLSLIDQSEISARKLKRVETELITYRNLSALLSLPPAEASPREEGYAPARSMIRPGAPAEIRRAFLARRRGVEGIGERDGLMAAEIRRLLEETAGGGLVHVGGWTHLVEDPEGETLFSRLRDLEPRRLLLGDDHDDG